jgi:predicted TIM-barrel fold metal-dependent hydrolase
MIIDSHMHIGTSEKLSGRHLTFQSYYNLMIKSEISKSAAIPNLSSVVKSSTLNRKMMDDYISSKFKDMFYPIILMDPKDADTLNQIDEYRDIIYGIKYHPSIAEAPLMDKSTYKFLDSIAEHDLPLLVHCGRHWRSHISYIAEAASEFPSTIFVAAHMGGNVTDLIIKALHIVRNCESSNIYFDTSASKLPWLIEQAVRLVGPDKILFGSDEPYADLRIAKYCIDICNISDKDRELIFYRNFERIYTDGK